MGALKKPTGGGERPPRFAVISDDAPHLSARRRAVQASCPQSGLIMLFTDVMSVGNLMQPEATLSCLGCGEVHEAAACDCRTCG